jgi:hypothetical protein
MDKQSFSQPNIYFIEHLMGMSKKPPREIGKLEPFDPTTREQDHLSPTIIQNTARAKLKSSKIEHRQQMLTVMLWLTGRK